MTLYTLALTAHSFLRWAILIALVWQLVRSFGAVRSRRRWTERDERLHVILVALVDLQLLLGLALYFGLSPLTQSFLAAPGPSMKNSVLRFFGVEHALLAFVALVVLHIGRARSRRTTDHHQRHRRVAISLSVVLVLLLAAMPIPGRPDHRPLIRIGAS